MPLRRIPQQPPSVVNPPYAVFYHCENKECGAVFVVQLAVCPVCHEGGGESDG